METTIEQAIEAAARDLPNGYLIEIFVDRGMAWVRLEGPHGNGIKIPCASTASISEQVQEATRKAIELEKETAD